MSLFDFFRRPKEPGKLFKEGQEVTLKDTAHWVVAGTQMMAYGPKFGEVYKVSNYHCFKNGHWYICIEWFPFGAFRESDFAPVLTNDQLEDALGELNRIVMIEH